MKKSFVVMCAGLVWLYSLVSVAHEGHSHAKQKHLPHHAGRVKAGRHLIVEGVLRSDAIVIYLRDLNDQAVKPSQLTVSSSVVIIDGKKTPVTFSPEGDFWIAKYAVGALPEIQIEVRVKFKNHVETLNLNLERME